MEVEEKIKALAKYLNCEQNQVSLGQFRGQIIQNSVIEEPGDLCLFDVVRALCPWCKGKNKKCEGCKGLGTVDLMYLVCTDEEAYAHAKERIADKLYLEEADFLASITGLHEEEIEEVLSEYFECRPPRFVDANYMITKIVEDTCGLDKIIHNIIANAGGRGHFLNSWDYETENKIEHEGETLYIYMQ